MEYLTSEQAMKLLKIKSYKSLRSYVANGLPVITIGRSRRYTKESIDQFMKDHEANTPKKEG